MNKKKLYIILTMIISSIIMSMIDGIIQPSYFIKSLIKICLFLLIPFLYFIINKDEIYLIKQLFIPKKKDLIISLLLGIIVYIVIISAYFICRNYIDFTSIQQSLTQNGGINKDNFIYVSIYISFINSLLEEFFFRGYSFIILKEKTNRIFAYILSALLFAFYHVGMTSGWFNPIIYILSMLGLFIGGCIFNYLNERFNHIYPSWLVHMFANFAINTIGFMLFQII